MICKGQVVNAVYLESEVPDYQGNPLIEALPPVRTTAHAVQRLELYPRYSEEHRNAPDHVRFHILQNRLKFFAPLDIHLDLERRFSCLIRVGYAGRNPVSDRFWNEFESKMDSLDQYSDQYQSVETLSSTATGFSIIGISGIGKSLSIERILKTYPQVIHHRDYKGHDFIHSQVVWLKLDCPFDGSPRGLCINFFQAMDDRLGTNYEKDYTRGRATVDTMLPNMARVGSIHFIGALVIDEIQRLNQANSGGVDKMLNFFVQLVNTIGIPVVIVGNFKALSILAGDFSQMRRGTGQGDLVWDRMVEDDQWQLFVEPLWRYQYTKKSCSLTDELSSTLYEVTQGITDLAVKVYMFAQERAIDSGKESVTSAMIKSAAKDKLCLLTPVLEALKLDNKSALEQYEDLYPTIFKTYLQESSTDIDITGVVATRPEIAALENDEPTNKTSSAQSESQPNTNNNSENSEVSSNSPAASTEIKTKRRPRIRTIGGKRIKPEGKGELPKIVAGLQKKHGLAAYEALKQAGYIRPACEYLASRNVANT
jgi:hypothetical protein